MGAALDFQELAIGTLVLVSSRLYGLVCGSRFVIIFCILLRRATLSPILSASVGLSGCDCDWRRGYVRFPDGGVGA